MGADALEKMEGKSFVEWRQELARIEEELDLVMTPFEKNLDFWRQLWRVVERSDLLVQILDARDPLFYRCEDLERYVSEVGTNKRHLLLLNKADFLPPELRAQWRAFFVSRGVDVIFFSALRELNRQQRLPTAQAGPSDADDALAEPSDADAAAIAPHGPLTDDPDVADCETLFSELHRRLEGSADGADVGAEGDGQRAPVVGFVGLPNVGKSSVINALYGAKKVSMSRQPGKTKHFQTLEMPERGLTLCDCPGLVFPSVVATKAHLIINSTIPLDQLNSFLPPIELVIQKMGANRLAEHYGCSAELASAHRELRNAASPTDAARVILGAVALARRHFLRVHVPDESWAARRVLKDFCTGALLHCEPPPEKPPASGQPSSTAISVTSLPSEPLPFDPPARGGQGDEEDDDHSDLDEFLREEASGGLGRMTKRKARMLQKRMSKGSAVLVR